MALFYYLSKSELNAINSDIDVQYFVTVVNIEKHTHPLYVSRCIKEQEEKLGLGFKNKHFSSVVAIWEGDLFDSFEEIAKKLRSNQKWLDTYKRELEAKFKQLKNAIELYNDGLFTINSKENNI